MNAENVWYIDSSAIVKLVAREPESGSLLRFLRRGGPLVASALARSEVNRSVLGLGERFHRRAADVLSRIDLVRVSNQVLETAGRLEPATVRTLDAIHLATAGLFDATLSGVITYDDRMAGAAQSYGWTVSSPS
jgi:predicted nucleic acid-binding protein